MGKTETTIWIIQSSDGRRTWTTPVRSEAMLYAWLSSDFFAYNVYRRGGSAQPLMFPYDFF